MNGTWEVQFTHIYPYTQRCQILALPCESCEKEVGLTLALMFSLETEFPCTWMLLSPWEANAISIDTHLYICTETKLHAVDQQVLSANLMRKPHTCGKQWSQHDKNGAGTGGMEFIGLFFFCLFSGMPSSLGKILKYFHCHWVDDNM